MFRLYRKYISPFLHGFFTLFFGFRGGCRYHPSCSNYFEESVRTHGVMVGSINGLKRVLRCHPFARGGFDPVKDRLKDK